MTIGEYIKKIPDKVREQPILYRFILLAVAINITIKIFNYDEYWFNFISSVNFAFHEAGHIFTMYWASQQVVAIAGSVSEVLIPLIFMFIAIKQLYFFDAAIIGVWVATNLHYIGGYIIDSMQFLWPMSQFFGPDSIHDWNYLLTEWDLLWRYREIGDGVILSSRILSAASVGFAVVFLVWQIILKIKYTRMKKELDAL